LSAYNVHLQGQKAETNKCDGY